MGCDDCSDVNGRLFACESLTNFWSEKLRAIDSKKISTQKDICKPHTLPASLHKVLQDSLRYDNLREKIVQQAEERNVEIKNSLAKEIKSCLKSDLLNLSQKIDNISFGGGRNLSQVEFEISHFRAKNVIEKLDLVPPLQMRNDAKSTLAKVNTSVFNFHKELKNRGKELEENLKDQKPVRIYDRYLESAAENLSNDFDTFFESIRVYHAGMFSLGVRSAISTLGLGEKFDLLDNNELTEEEKTARKREAQEHVFVDKGRAFSHFPDVFSILEARCKAVEKNVVSLSSSTPVNPKLPEEADMKDRAATELAVLADEVKSKLSDFERNINIELRTLFTKIGEEWKTEVNEVRRKRRERFVFTSVISTIIGDWQ